MSDRELKDLSNMLSDAYLRSEEEFESEYEKVCPKISNAREGYIIGKLCNLYCEIKTGAISKEIGTQRQTDIFAEAATI